jgi:hypothetical protein
MKPRLSVAFCDFWSGFDQHDNFFTRMLGTRFDLCNTVPPELVIYNDYGHHHRLYSCKRIHFTGESIEPEYAWCDASWSSLKLNDPRHLRVPYYAFHGPPEPLLRGPEFAASVLSESRKFCCFVVGKHYGAKTQRRVDLFQHLHARRAVDSGGAFLNNIGRRLGPNPGDKLDFLRGYRFNICYENGAFPGYTTEKLYDALAAGCIPIYWGDPDVAQEFNPKAFINSSDFPDEAALIDHILAVADNPARQAEYLEQPPFVNNIPPKIYAPERLTDFVERLLADPTTPVAQRPHFPWLGRWTMAKRDK